MFQTRSGSRSTRAAAPGGTLYNVAANLFRGALAGGNATYMSVSRSTDAGPRWSSPVQIAPIRTAQLFAPDDPLPDPG